MDHFLSTIFYVLYTALAATLHAEHRRLHPQPEDALFRGE